MRRIRARYAVVLAVVLCGCVDTAKDWTGGESAKVAAQTTALTGQFIRGDALEGARAGIRAGIRADVAEGVRASSLRRQMGDPLADHALYCVTFESEPKAAKGLADIEGRFQVTIESIAPFGCFVLDPEGARVAELSFLKSERSPDGNFALTGATQLAGSADIGEVLVDLDTSVALAEIQRSVPVIVDRLWDPTGTWKFVQCVETEPRSCKGDALTTYASLFDDKSLYFRLNTRKCG
ncbi:MAG: hypothetical protein HYY13_04260 [Nitrospirae bacterium]|nr:hypothetical protein [Nitrospirota bacterium]